MSDSVSRQYSLKRTNEFYDRIVPFLRELDENPPLKSWFVSMEYIDPATRAGEFEKLAAHSDSTDSDSGYGNMFRLFRDPAIYAAGLHTLRKL